MNLKGSHVALVRQPYAALFLSLVKLSPASVVTTKFHTSRDSSIASLQNWLSRQLGLRHPRRLARTRPLCASSHGGPGRRAAR